MQRRRTAHPNSLEGNPSPRRSLARVLRGPSARAGAFRAQVAGLVGLWRGGAGGARWRCALRAAIVSSAAAQPAAAHLDLTSPVPRESGRVVIGSETNGNLKEGPCGQLENGRTERVNVFSPGETIVVAWVEYVNHDSYYRVAFDAEGDDDFPAFAGPGVAAEGHDPRAYCPVDGHTILAYELEDRRGGAYEIEVTLPDIECERCTLQVIQYMYGRGRQQPYYFQCADLALRRSASRADAGADAAVPPAPRGSLDAGVELEDAGGRDASTFAAVAAESCWQALPPGELPPLAPLPDAGSGAGGGGGERSSEAPPELRDAGGPSVGSEVGGAASGGCGCRVGSSGGAPPAVAWVLPFLALCRRRYARGGSVLRREQTTKS